MLNTSLRWGKLQQLIDDEFVGFGSDLILRENADDRHVYVLLLEMLLIRLVDED